MMVNAIKEDQIRPLPMKFNAIREGIFDVLSILVGLNFGRWLTYGSAFHFLLGFGTGCSAAW